MLELETLKETLFQGRKILPKLRLQNASIYLLMKDVLFIQKFWLNKKPEHHNSTVHS